MKIAVFSTKRYDRDFLSPAAEQSGHELTFFEPRLVAETAVLATGFPAICSFVNDQLNRDVLRQLSEQGTRFIVLRCAGFNQVDLPAARELGIRVARVPAYSPYAVAEHTVALMLTLNRRTHIAFQRVREGNFSLDRLLGFDLHGKSVGIIGTGQIGRVAARILHGFGCELWLHDPYPSPNLDAWGTYVPLEQLWEASDIITLHCPLTPETRYLINPQSIQKMRDGVMLINTSRGGLVDTQAVIQALKLGKIGYLGLDVYEEEADLFFEDLSGQVIQDDVFSRLLTFPNVVITAHQAFFTQNALEEIARVTMANATALERGDDVPNEVRLP